MKSRYQIRTLTITSVLVLVMLLVGQISLPFTALAEGNNIEPPRDPFPTNPDTVDVVPPDATNTSTATATAADPSLLDVIITIVDVIL